ncbi:hypothetical protein FQN54_009984 [Arachnomyces sp. PD_36]|nr:hypothetical protein FQN54_009984 [Arachnomyces sp. PD_36]
MSVAGILLRFSNVILRALQLCTSVIIVGIFGYFIGVLVDHNAHIPRWVKAVEGLAGLAALYTLFGVLLTLFLGGKMFFAMLAVALDVCFIASFIAIAAMTRGGHRSCSGNVSTPIGSGPSSNSSGGLGRFGNRYRPNLSLACRLQKGVFALAIIGIFLFMLSILSQLLLARHRKREQRYGPSPANDYTSGREKKFWKRGHRGATADAERGVPNGGTNGTATGTTAVAGANGAATEKHGGFWKFGRHQQNGGVANGYTNGAARHAAQPQQQTATYGTGTGGTSAPTAGGEGYSYVNSAPGYNVPQPAQGQYGAANF